MKKNQTILSFLNEILYPTSVVRRAAAFPSDGSSYGPDETIAPVVLPFTSHAPYADNPVLRTLQFVKGGNCSLFSGTDFQILVFGKQQSTQLSGGDGDVVNPAGEVTAYSLPLPKPVLDGYDFTQCCPAVSPAFAARHNDIGFRLSEDTPINGAQAYLYDLNTEHDFGPLAENECILTLYRYHIHSLPHLIVSLNGIFLDPVPSSSGIVLAARYLAHRLNALGLWTDNNQPTPIWAELPSPETPMGQNAVVTPWRIAAQDNGVSLNTLPIGDTDEFIVTTEVMVVKGRISGFMPLVLQPAVSGEFGDLPFESLGNWPSVIPSIFRGTNL